ncbi:MAG TPA: chemotaxis protein CheW [Candidatus Nitrosotenuis sp.]|nr:chemotaxis protein CheW [Candidatus Nitrosotenuis sp.]
MMTQAVATDTTQVVSFNIVGSSGRKEDYAVPIEQVREIRAVEKITKVPRSEPYVKGIMNLRGLIIPVIDVKEKLGLGSGASSSKQRILVADVKGSLTGLLVDEVDQVMRIQTKDIEAAPQGALESYHYVKGIAKVNERLLVLLDVEGLLGGQKETQQSAPPKAKHAKPNAEAPQKTEKTDPLPTIDDIPAELAEVFKEDAEGIPPTQIHRDN